MFPFGFLCGAHITGREERIGAIHFGKQVGNRFKCVVGTTDSVRHIKRKHVLGVEADVFASNLQRLLQVGSKAGSTRKFWRYIPVWTMSPMSCMSMPWSLQSFCVMPLRDLSSDFFLMGSD